MKVPQIHSEAAAILGTRIRDIRTRVGITLEDLGALAEMHWTSVGKIERDQVEDYAARKGMSLRDAERWLAPILNYTPQGAVAAE